MTAATACRTCGSEPREGAQFCDACGAPVIEHDNRAEYKQVTVLFADVVHSMDIASAVGAERLREIMAWHRHGLVRRVIGCTVLSVSTALVVKGTADDELAHATASDEEGRRERCGD